MKELIMSLREFRIKSEFGERQIRITKKSKDSEFSSWEESDGRFYLVKRESKERVELLHNARSNAIEGRDKNGNHIELYPLNGGPKKEFDKFFSSKKREETFKYEKEVEYKNDSNVAVVTNGSYVDFDTYQVEGDLFKLVDGLFQNGYDEVIISNPPATEKEIKKLEKNAEREDNTVGLTTLFDNHRKFETFHFRKSMWQKLKGSKKKRNLVSQIQDSLKTYRLSTKSVKK